MDTNQNNEQLADDASKQVTGRLSSAGRTMGKQAAGLLGKGVKAGAKGAIRFLGSFAATSVRMLLACWPIVVAAFLILFFMMVVYNWHLDERGSSGQLTQDYRYENPTQTVDGVLTAAALTEPQALIDAYYKYLSCDSHTKLYVAPDGTEVTLTFSDTDDTLDFTTLMDLYSKENYFYLSSYFIKMSDELLHENEFYYPEQVIKPVFSDVLPLNDGSGKKYITTLPLVDDGSENAKAILNGTQAYAVKDTVSADAANPEKRKPPTSDATLSLLAQSKVYEKGNVTLTDDEGRSETFELYHKQHESNQTAGIWDYGFGSIIQYEPEKKDVFIECEFKQFRIHLHHYEIIGYDEEGGAIWGYVCRGSRDNRTISVTASDTAASLQAKINACATGYFMVKDKPSYSQLQLMTNRDYNSHVAMKIRPEDHKLAQSTYDDGTLKTAFGNEKDPNDIDNFVYPIKIPVISAAATFSGNIRYEYDREKTSSQLRVAQGDFHTNYNDDYTDLLYLDSDCAGEDLIAVRSGYVWTDQPSSMPKEISSPIGFQYVTDYDNHYEIYVPDTVRKDMDFTNRVSKRQGDPDDYRSDLDANKDGNLTVLDFLINLGLLTPYAQDSLSAVSGGFTASGNATANEDQLLSQAGVANTDEGQVELLAKVIMAEAGPNKLDQLMVASVVMNRVYDSRFPNSLIGVITAPGQYASWANGSIQSRQPTQQALSSARQVLNGEFAIPSNVVFQKVGSEGKMFMIVINGPGYYNHTYSISVNDDAIAQTDRFGRVAMTAGQLRNLAANLNNADVSSGYASNIVDPGIAATPENLGYAPISSIYPLYQSDGFDVMTALKNMQRLTDRQEGGGFLSQIAHFVSDALSNIKAQIFGFFNYVSSAFGDNDAPKYYEYYNHNVALETIYDTVYQAITFSNKTTYGATADSIDTDALTFLFVGKEGGIGTGTNGMGQTLISGTGSTLSGFLSPTNSHYQTLVPWNEVNGNVTLTAPEGTIVQAVYDGLVTSVDEDDGNYTLSMTSSSDSKSIVITYSGLSSVDVVSNQSVTKGDSLGRVGEHGLVMKLVINGRNVDPMQYFYQPVVGSGAAFMNILNENGYVDNALKNQLEQAINAANNNQTNTCDQWHVNPPNNKSRGECTWWAWGRGLQYCQQNGTLPSSGLSGAYGNGGDYYDRAQAMGQFAVGSVPKAGSWIVWKKPNDYGHVAFVEAVEKNGDIWISESARNIWGKRDGRGVLVRKISGPSYIYNSKYVFQGFVYLDSPK